MALPEVIPQLLKFVAPRQTRHMGCLSFALRNDEHILTGSCNEVHVRSAG